MDESTRGVTLHSIFILKVVEPFRSMERLCAPLFEMVRELEGVEPTAPASMALYNDVCGWIEQNLGAASVRAAGESIGRNAYRRMLREGAISEETAPGDALAALARAVLVTIQDPRKRGWEILESVEGRARMRRTQTFNCVMQEGVLRAFIEDASVNPRVDHVRCTRRGDPFCEYDVRWLPRARR